MKRILLIVVTVIPFLLTGAEGVPDGPDFNVHKIELGEVSSIQKIPRIILSPQPDTISYDDNAPHALYLNPGLWSGARFTPQNPFELKSIYFAIHNPFSQSPGCSLYVTTDASGFPSSTVLAGPFFVAGPLPNLTWNQVDLTTPVLFNAGEDFHIIYGPQPGGMNYPNNPSEGWWDLFDNGTTTYRSHASFDRDSGWATDSVGDFFIRAGGEYTGLPSNFHLEGVSGGWGPWTRLLRLEIDSAGHGSYWIMYPQDRDTGIYTLLDTFTLSSAQLASLYNSSLQHGFFTMDTLYTGDKSDGSFCDLEIKAGGVTHRVLTTNIEVPHFDSLIQDINTETPGDRDLIYNELFLSGPEPPGQEEPKQTVVWRTGCTIYVQLRIEFSGPCATEALAAAWKTNIQNVWNRNGNYFRYGCCPCGCGCGCEVYFHVLTSVRDQNDPPTAGYHQINVPCDNSADGDGHISSVNNPLPQPNGASGSGNWDNNEPNNTPAHEAGHLMGENDQYTVTSRDPYRTKPNAGHENDIMATLGGQPQQSAVDNIISKSGVDCPWYCCPCFWFVYVSDMGQPNNYDLYRYDMISGISYRLTANPGIDNHPDVWQHLIVWSSTGDYVGTNPDGDFEIFVADISDIPGTVRQLTFNDFPDRHPHFYHDGSRIIYSSKRKCETLKRDQCSIPVNPECDDPDTVGGPLDGSLYEGLNIIRTDGTGLTPLDLRSAAPWWPTDNASNEGHASFSHDGTEIIFGADTAGHGDNWEVYVMDYDSSSNIISNLQPVTKGPEIGPNPIKMSAGPHFGENDSTIVFSSTRTAIGNSQIFEVPATARNLPVTSAVQLTDNCANDYVPEPMCMDRILFVSDRGLVNNVCTPCGTGMESPTYDLDVFIMNSDGSAQANLTNNDASDDVLLIGDEVSWFCGIKPNLSPCTYYPKIWEMCWINTVYEMWRNPYYLPDFPNRHLYPIYWNELNQYMMQENPQYWMYILQHMGDSLLCHEKVVIPSLATRPPDSTFTLECSPDTNHATPGDLPSILYTINVNSFVGYHLPVDLELANVNPPAGITAMFNPDNLPAPYTSNVTIGVPPSTPYGDYTLTFKGMGGDGQRNTCQATLRVQSPFVCGDCNGDEIIDVGDVVCMINYLFKGGPTPNPSCLCDVNCDHLCDVGDVVYLINYLFKGGTSPCTQCCL
jgi:hypothetical protein